MTSSLQAVYKVNA